MADPSAAADPLLRACTGASLRAARIAAGPDAMVTQLGYTWDMSAMFFTYKAIGMLHNDRKEYVTAMRKKYHDVFKNEQTQIQTMETLPHIVMRFPGIPPDADSSESYPLSDPMPLRVSRVQQADSHKELTKSNPQLTTDFISMFIGRSVDADDPEVESTGQQVWPSGHLGAGATCLPTRRSCASRSWRRCAGACSGRRTSIASATTGCFCSTASARTTAISAGSRRCSSRRSRSSRNRPCRRGASNWTSSSARASVADSSEGDGLPLDDLGGDDDFSDEVDLFDMSEDGMRTLYARVGLDYDQEQRRYSDDEESRGSAFSMETDEDDSDRHLYLWSPHLMRTKRTKGRTWAAQEKRQREGEPPEHDPVNSEIASRIKRTGTERKRKDAWDAYYIDQLTLVPPPRKKQSTSAHGSHASSPGASGASTNGEARA